MIETFPHDSRFIADDLRKDRWAIPYHYEALNSRVENIICRNIHAFREKRILDLGCHFGTIAFASLHHGAASVYGVDSESSLIEQAHSLFETHGITQDRYSFSCDDVLSFMAGCADSSFDTVLCLGLLYYLNDPFAMLRDMKRVAKRYIMIDTFTAYYGAIMSKEGDAIFNNTSDGTFDLPIVLYPLTQAQKRDYTLKSSFNKQDRKKLGMLALPSVPALENFFELLELKYFKLPWDDYGSTSFSWKDFVRPEVKTGSHWADVYHTGIRAAYLLEVRE